MNLSEEERELAVVVIRHSKILSEDAKDRITAFLQWAQEPGEPPQENKRRGPKPGRKRTPRIQTFDDMGLQVMCVFCDELIEGAPETDAESEYTRKWVHLSGRDDHEIIVGLAETGFVTTQDNVFCGTCREWLVWEYGPEFDDGRPRVREYAHRSARRDHDPVPIFNRFGTWYRGIPGPSE
jgi:hypothetical protein